MASLLKRAGAGQLPPHKFWAIGNLKKNLFQSGIFFQKCKIWVLQTPFRTSYRKSLNFKQPQYFLSEIWSVYRKSATTPHAEWSEETNTWLGRSTARRCRSARRADDRPESNSRTPGSAHGQWCNRRHTDDVEAAPEAATDIGSLRPTTTQSYFFHLNRSCTSV